MNNNFDGARFEGKELDEFGFVFKPKLSKNQDINSLRPEVINGPRQNRRLLRWDEFYGRSDIQRSVRLKRFCRKGVPTKYRIQTWLAVTDAGRKVANHQEVFANACQKRCSLDAISVIFEDLRRTFPENKEFQGSGARSQQIQSQLKLVLEAFASFKPEPGYCQGMNSICGMLLLLRASTDEAFWLTEHLVFRLVPTAYYGSDLTGLRIERLVFKDLVQKYCPAQYAKINEFSGFELYFDKWLICLLIDILPTELVLRIWDLLFYEGYKSFHRASITVIHKLRAEILAANDFMALAELFSTLNSNPMFFDSSAFIKDMFALTSSLSKQTIQKLRVKNAPVIEQENKETQIRVKEREAWLAKHKQKEKEAASRRQTSLGRPASATSSGSSASRKANYASALF